MKKYNDLLKLNEKAWKNIAKKYEKHRPKGLEQQNPIFDYFYSHLPKEGLILDLGSGTGLPYAKLFINKGFKVLGVDLSENMVKLAKKNVPQGNFIHLSMTELDYKDKFDGVFSSFCRTG